jgi:hypothetical protein
MAKKKAAKKKKTTSKTKSGPIQKLAQKMLPGAKKRQARRKKRRSKIANAVKKAAGAK